MPRKPLLHELLHEWIWIELLDIVHPRLAPESLEEHQCADRSRYPRGIADTLSACLLEGSLVATVVPDIVGLLLTVLDTTDASADARLARIVLAELSWVR